MCQISVQVICTPYILLRFSAQNPTSQDNPVPWFFLDQIWIRIPDPDFSVLAIFRLFLWWFLWKKIVPFIFFGGLNINNKNKFYSHKQLLEHFLHSFLPRAGSVIRVLKPDPDPEKFENLPGSGSRQKLWVRVWIRNRDPGAETGSGFSKKNTVRIQAITPDPKPWL